MTAWVCMTASLWTLNLATPSMSAQEHDAKEPQSVKSAKDGAEQQLPAEAEAAFKKGDISGLYDDVIAQLKTLASSKSIKELLADPTAVHLASVEEIIRLTGKEELAELMRKDRKYALFLNVFFKNTDWMQTYLSAGLVPTKTDVGLRVLADIWAEDGKSPDFDQYFDLAVALASCWGAGNYGEQLQRGETLDTVNGRTNPLWRYNFFKTSHKDKKLHKNFAKLKPWELRFVAGINWDDASLKYMQDNLNIPPSQYGDACWMAEYTGTSEFGHDIQTPFFYIAWGHDKGQAELTCRHGGVCGALSHVGVAAAASRGIPTYPVGQPGHCAYGFRPERGEWQGGFGGPDGGMHNYIFNGGRAPTSYRLMEAVFADDDNVAAAYKAFSLAEALSIALPTNKEKVKEAWREALRLSPLNPVFHKDFQEWAKANSVYTPDQWREYALATLAIHKGHGYAAMEVLDGVDPLFIINSGKRVEGEKTLDEQRMEWYALEHEILAETPGSWSLDITPLVEAQDTKLDSLDTREKYLKNLLSTYLKSGDGANFGKILEWAIKTYVKGNRSKVFAQAFTEAAENAPSPDAKEGLTDKQKTDSERALREAYGKAVIAAETSRSVDAVRAITKVGEKFKHAPDASIAEADLDCPPGVLVSPNGYMRLSSTCNWDSPISHLDVLTKQGGSFHTDKQDKPAVIVELENGVNLTGLLLVKNGDNQQRMKKMKVSRSVDGATWFEVATTDDMPRQWKIETPDNPAARFIKVESLPESPDYFHLRNILIFAK